MKMRHTMKILLPALLSAILASGGSFMCGSETTVIGVIDEDFSHIEDPLERWRAYDIQDYEIHQIYSCFCAPPHEWTAVIQNGKVVDAIVKPIDGMDPDEMHARALEMAWTVEEAFEQIRSMPGGRGLGNGPGPADLQVTYHSRFGYPESVYIDWDHGIADDELHLQLDNLSELDQ